MLHWFAHWAKLGKFLTNPKFRKSHIHSSINNSMIFVMYNLDFVSDTQTHGLCHMQLVACYHHCDMQSRHVRFSPKKMHDGQPRCQHVQRTWRPSRRVRWKTCWWTETVADIGDNMTQFFKRTMEPEAGMFDSWDMHAVKTTLWLFSSATTPTEVGRTCLIQR